MCDIIFIQSLWNKFYYYPHFTGEDTKPCLHKISKQKRRDGKNWHSEPRAFLRDIWIILVWNSLVVENHGWLKKKSSAIQRNRNNVENVLPCFIQMVKFSKCKGFITISAHSAPQSRSPLGKESSSVGSASPLPKAFNGFLLHRNIHSLVLTPSTTDGVPTLELCSSQQGFFHFF